MGCADQLCTFCPTPAWCLSCPHCRLCLTTTGFGSHSPSCSFSTLAPFSLEEREESRPESRIKEQHHLKAGGVATQLQRHMPLIPGEQSCQPCLEPPAPRPLWGSPHDSRIVEADPTVVAVRVAISATHWFQVPWASYPGPPILGDATGVWAAIKLWKQPRISPDFGSLRERNPPASSHHHHACSCCWEANQRRYWEPAQAVRRRESSRQKFLIMHLCKEAGWLWVRQCLMKAGVIGSPSAPQRILPDRAALQRVPRDSELRGRNLQTNPQLRPCWFSLCGIGTENYARSSLCLAVWKQLSESRRLMFPSVSS